MESHRCLIDRGSEVCLISARDAIKHRFSHEFGGIKTVRGFAGSSSLIDGLVTCKISIGRSHEPRKFEFLETPAATIPILGCPTLAELQITVDCQERVLSDNQGSFVRLFCYLQFAKMLSKPTDPIRLAGMKGLL